MPEPRAVFLLAVFVARRHPIMHAPQRSGALAACSFDCFGQQGIGTLNREQHNKSPT
ncbi:MAG: hypothetical protein ACI86S_002415, partial [Paracoccaceae bacterium]